MDSITASFISLTLNGNNSTSASGAGVPGAADSAFTDMLNMAEMVLSPASGGQAGGSAGIASVDSCFSQIFSLLQEVESGMENVLSGINPANAPTTQPASNTSTAGGLSAEALHLMQEGGPLPAFLNAMDSQGNLSPAEQQSLWNIAAENMGPHPDTQTIAAELQQAGIPETIPSSLQV